MKEHLQKKHLIFFWLPVEDIKIPYIFYKIQNFQGPPWASIIASCLIKLLRTGPFCHISRLFWVFAFLVIFSVFQKKMVFGYSWSTLLWHRCYYPHRSRDTLSPVCGIFLLINWDLSYFRFCHNLIKVLSQFEFLSLVTIWVWSHFKVFGCHNLSLVTIWVF